MRVRGRRRSICSAAMVAMVAAISACGNQAASQNGTPPAFATATATPAGTPPGTSIASSASPSGPALPCGGPCFPLTDTPLSSAPPALHAAWRDLVDRTIPGQEVLAHIPTVAANSADPEVSTAQAQVIVNAWLREAALEQWSDRVDTGSLGAEKHILAAEYTVSGPLGRASASGSAVDAPDCDFFPTPGTKVTVVSVDPTVLGELHRRGQALAEARGLLVSYPACVTHADGVVIDRSGEGVMLITGHIVEGSVIGAVLYVDGNVACGDLPLLAATCAKQF